MKTTLTVEIDYDPATTDPEGLACAMDRLLETALSAPDILAEYGNPAVGDFSVAPAPKVVLNLSGGVLQDVFSSDPRIKVVLVDWDVEGCDPSEDGIVQIADGRGRMQLAAVAEYPVWPLEKLVGTETAAALQAAGVEWGDCDQAVGEFEQYPLHIDGPAFRAQRELLMRITDLAQRKQSYAPAPGDEGLLEGLVELTDAMADQAHDQHGIDCLLHDEETQA